jgi:hypothetical protein
VECLCQKKCSFAKCLCYWCKSSKLGITSGKFEDKLNLWELRTTIVEALMKDTRLQSPFLLDWLGRWQAMNKDGSLTLEGSAHHMQRLFRHLLAAGTGRRDLPEPISQSCETQKHFLAAVLGCFDDGQQHIRVPTLMTQTQQLQPSSAAWPAQTGLLEAAPEAAPKASQLPASYDREKYRSTAFFVWSTIAGGIAGCTVHTFSGVALI